MIDNVEARTGIHWIDRDTCVALLRQDVVGRLAVVNGHAPAIFPVNYVMDGEAIVFRTDPGTKLTAGPRAPACFEIDGIDRQTRHGWSVVVTGRLEEVTDFDARAWEHVHELPVEPWAGGDKGHFMRLVAGSITGRSIGPVPTAG